MAKKSKSDKSNSKKSSSKKGTHPVRPFWSGTISFGLVSVPVNLFPATRRNRLSLRMLSEKGRPLSRRYFNPENGKEVPYDSLLRGYEIEPEKWITVTDEELDSVEPEKSREIDLRRFVSMSDIPPIYFERAYFLTPTGDTTKAYRLLAEVMESTGKAGIATFVMRGKEYLIAILAEGGILRAETLRFADEIRSPDDVGLPEQLEVNDSRVKEFSSAISSLEQKSILPSEMKNEELERLQELVEQKKKKGKDLVEIDASDVAEEDREEGEVDLFETIRQSLKGVDPNRARREPSRKGKPSPASRRAGAGKKGDYESMTKSELYDLAQKKDVPGRSSMSKAELIKAIT